MKKLKVNVDLLMVLLVTVFFLSSVVPAYAASLSQEEPVIRVGILTNQINALISAGTNYELVDQTGKSIGKYKAQEKTPVSVNGAGIAVNGVLVNASSIRVKIATENGASYIEVNKRKYRGDIDIHRTLGKNSLTVVNTLPVEQYIYGIITKEISAEWPMEAIKAQAVAARTYALFNLNKHKKDGFDVCATTDCQVYGGRDSEVPRATKAVDDTHGIVMLHRGKLIPAFFHSSGGGYTENSENVWGGYHPFLRAVPDFDQKGPQYKWEKTFTPAQLEEALKNAGYDVGALRTIELSKLVNAPMQSLDRGVSGRVKTIKVTGSGGAATLTGMRFRSALGLPSTLFDIQMVLPPVNKTIDFEITDSYGDRETKKVEVNVAPLPEKGLGTDKDNIRRLTYRSNEVITIKGFGSGHGVGMSQWGAKAMAEKASSTDSEYFKSILKHYYQGVEIQKTY